MNRIFFRMLCISVFGYLMLTACEISSSEKSKQQNPESVSTQASLPPKQLSSPNFQAQAFQNENGSWGYDILQNGKVFIHQPDKPGIGGRLGFQKKKQALAVAEFVVQKISKGIMPPSVQANEIDSLLNLFP